MYALLLFALRGAAAAPSPPPAASSSPDWESTLERVSKAVVVLRVDGTRSFDTETARATFATGFVVDAERGIILTNRHVVQPGPVVAEAVFLDHEEVPVQPIYRDPLHDFGFYRYDPALVRHMANVALDLVPAHARVGIEVRVVGNDAGEKISILDGTLARLDRPAPDYGRDGYNDANTFYYQAASSTSGGSSGSPVVDIHGHVIALNAGANRGAASSYYLPLDRVVRALDLVRQGKAVARGTVQAIFAHLPYDEVRRLGLRPEVEEEVRAAFPDGTGMLVVKETIPKGPAWEALAPGDIVVRVGGKLINAFIPLEEALDAGVGGEVAMEVERGDQALPVVLRVQDFDEVTPAEYLEMGGAVFHAASLQQARNHVVPTGGVVVANPGYMLYAAGIPREALIVGVGDTVTPDLDAFEAKMATLPDGARVAVRWFDLSDPAREQVDAVRVDRRWFPMQRCARDDKTGAWPCRLSAAPAAAEPTATATTSYPRLSDATARALAPSLCLIEFDVPYRVEGTYGSRFRGAGVVVDAARGLVVTDRDTVPNALGDVTLTFAGAVRIPGRVVAVHPEHNLAAVAYDPGRLGGTPVRGATLDVRPLEEGDEVRFVGLTSTHDVVSRATRIGRIDPLSLPLPWPPFFRDVNLETLQPEETLSSSGGVLADRRGHVRALWASFARLDRRDPDSIFRGIPSGLVEEFVAPLRAGRPFLWRSLGVEWEPVSLAEARDRGLPEDEAHAIEAHDPRRRQVLAVARVTAGTAAARQLREGDLLLAVGGRPATSFREVEQAAQAERVRLRVLRGGDVIEDDIATDALDPIGSDRVVVWAGALLHAPHLAASAQRETPRDGVFVSWFWYGSPADRSRLRPPVRITEVDGRPVPDLDAFLAAVAGKEDRSPVRLRVVDLNDRVDVLTLKLDLRYWSTSELRLGPDGWTRSP